VHGDVCGPYTILMIFDSSLKIEKLREEPMVLLDIGLRLRIVF
jgi:hypothetical protein